MKLTLAELERLAILSEEMSEAQQIIGKIIRHGYTSKHPNGGLNNRQLLEFELGHVKHAIVRMCKNDDISHTAIDHSEIKKALTIVPFLHYQ